MGRTRGEKAAPSVDRGVLRRCERPITTPRSLAVLLVGASGQQPDEKQKKRRAEQPLSSATAPRSCCGNVHSARCLLANSFKSFRGL